MCHYGNIIVIIRCSFEDVLIGNLFFLCSWRKGVECPESNTPFDVANAGNTVTFGCPVSGRYITILSPNSVLGAQLGICEVQVWAQNACPARTGVNATNLSGNCEADAPYGSVCTQECNPGTWPVAGSAVAECQGDDWSAPPLICAPMCPPLPPPPFTESCEMTWLNDDFSRIDPRTNLSLTPSRWQPLYQRQEWGTHWFAGAVPGAANIDAGSVVTASARKGCMNDMILVPTLTDTADWRGNFKFSASVLALDKAGLAFRVTGEPTASYYRMVGDRWSNSIALELVKDNTLTVIARTPFGTYDITKNDYTTFSVEAKGFTYTMSIEGVPLLTVTDNTLTSGSIGLYAQSQASFGFARFSVPCETCADVGDGDTCTYLPYPGMLLQVNNVTTTRWWPGSNATSMTCRGGSWVPSAPPAFILPPPSLGPMSATITEFSPANTPVGSPIGASVPVPGLQIGYEIVSGNAGPGGLPAFWIDQCDGSINVLNSAALDSKTAPLYNLLVRAFIIGITPAVASTANITIAVVQRIDTPPVVPAGQVLRLPENSAPNSPVGTLAFNASAAAGPLQWRIAIDGAAGRFSINPSTGLISVSRTNTIVLDYEAPPSSWTLAVEVHYQAYPTSSTTVAVTVALTDANDVPVMPSGAALRIPDTSGVGAAFSPAASAITTDPDSVNAGSPFLFPPRYALMPFSAYNTSCGFPVNPSTTWPTVNGTMMDTPLFVIDPVSGQMRLAAVATPPWASRPATPFFDVASRAVYVVCLNVSDTTGAWAPRIVFAGISAVTSGAEPVVAAYSLPPGVATGGFATTGGGIVTFTVSPTVPLSLGALITATYTNEQRWPGAPAVMGATNYSSPNCTVLNATVFTCTLAPGVGSGHRWRLSYNGDPMTSNVDVVTSYSPPRITSLLGNTNLRTTGGVGPNLIFSGTGFGPASSAANPVVPLSLQYGPGNKYTAPFVVSKHGRLTCLLWVPPSFLLAVDSFFFFFCYSQSHIKSTFARWLPFLSPHLPADLHPDAGCLHLCCRCGVQPSMDADGGQSGADVIQQQRQQRLPAHPLLRPPLRGPHHGD